MTRRLAVPRKTYITVPPTRPLSRAEKVERAIVGSVSSPLYFLLAYRRCLPGIRFARDSAFFALRSLLHGRRNIPSSELYRMLFWPVESSRYFEFHWTWRFLHGHAIRRYLDISSPRLFPISLAAD